MVRETALARVRAIGRISLEQIRVFEELGERVSRHLEDWSVADEDHMARIERLRIEWADLMQELPELLDQPKPIDQVIRVAEAFSLDCQELMVSFVLEPFGDMVDGLTECMGGSKMTRLDPRMGLSELQSAIKTHFDWVEELDFDDPDQVAQFWYVSEEKQEPRLGLRHEEPGAELESPLDIARQVHGLARDLAGATGTLATFLLEYPQHRAATQRVQMALLRPYGEIRDNLIDATCKPIDMLRCKLAFFGAAKLDPKSDRWTRITLAQGAPLFDELDDVDGWWMPVFNG